MPRLDPRNPLHALGNARSDNPPVAKIVVLPQRTALHAHGNARSDKLPVAKIVVFPQRKEVAIHIRILHVRVGVREVGLGNDREATCK